MKVSRGRLLSSLSAGLGLMALVLPASAQAHGIVGRADLPIPVWLFSWAAAIVLVISFVALSTLWQKPQLQEQHRRRLFRLPRLIDRLASLVGVGLFALVLYSGFAGAQVPNANFNVTFIYVIFWVGMPLASVLFGDIFSAFNPWRSCARAVRALIAVLPGQRSGGPPVRYPGWLGVWPAAGVVAGFAWLELVYIPADRQRPSTLAALSLGYFLVMLAGMALFGIEECSERADGFGVYWALLARLSPLCRDEQGVLFLRRPLSGITDLEVGPGMVALICTIIGTTTFDGFSNGGVWRSAEPSLATLFGDLGLNQTPALELAYTTGLIFCILLIRAVYFIGIAGVRSVGSRYGTGELTDAFAHTLVPIGVAYVLAHYFSLLIWQSQAMVYLASDPLGDGVNIFGTSGYEIDYHVISYVAIWYVQVAALLSGHVAGLMLAHDRALVMYRDPEDAIRSQYWMLAVMVAFTSFGLWLLSSVGT